jgi:hypothetical protein
MTDAFTAELFPPSALEAQRFVFPVSRLVCDVERFPHDADEPMAARGMGAVYSATMRAAAGWPRRLPARPGGFLALDWCAGTPLDALAPELPGRRPRLGHLTGVM